MKQFEPIVIEQETDIRFELRIEQSEYDTFDDIQDIIDLVVSEESEERNRIGITRSAAIRLRDALNTILND